VVYSACTFWQRLGGLLARSPLLPHEALYLAPCSSVHTCFMRYAIDVAFVDRNGTVLKLAAQLAPWRAAGCWGAHGVVELAAGQASVYGIRPGAPLDLQLASQAKQPSVKSST
jgi:uncharacterized protein